MSQTLIKFLDNIIFPAAMLVFSKLAGIIITSKILDISISVKDYTNTIFGVGTFVPKEGLVLMTSYSDLIMYILVAAFFSVSLVRAIFFHSTHVKPTLILKLADRNLLNLIKDSYEIYNTAAAWLLFLWISNVLVLVNVLNNTTYVWIGVVATVSSIVLSIAMFQDVNREIENIKQHPGQYKWN